MRKYKILTFILLVTILLCVISSCYNEDESFIVTFDTCGAGTVESVTVKEGERVEDIPTVQKAGSDFLGWYLGETPYDFNTPVTSDITLEAHWITSVDMVSLAGSWKGGGYVGEDEYFYYLNFSTEGVPTLKITLNAQTLPVNLNSFTSEAGRLKIDINCRGKKTLLFDVSTSLTGTGIGDETLVLNRYESVNVTYHYVDGRNKTVVVDKGSELLLPDGENGTGILLDGWYDINGNIYYAGDTVNSDIEIYESAYTEGLIFDGGVVVSYTGDEDDVIIPPFYQGERIIEIAKMAFAGSDIEQISFPSSVKTIAEEAFRDCTSLLDVELDGVEVIGARAFYNCNQFETVRIPSSVVSIGFAAFASDMQIVENDDIVMYTPSNSSIVSITVDSIIGDGDDAAFLAYMFGAPSADYIGYYREGTSIVVDGEQRLVNLIYTLPMTLEEVVITGDKPIPERAFYNCYYIEEIDLGGNISIIGTSAFEGCIYAQFRGLESVEVIGERAFVDSSFYGAKMPLLTRIGGMAFANTPLYEITLPSTLTFIGEGAFAFTELTKIVLPSGLEYIEDAAFFGCNYLENVYFLSEEPCNIGSNIFTEVDEEGTIYYSDVLIWVPNGNSYMDYRSNVNMRDYANSIFPKDFEGKSGYIVNDTLLLGYIGEERLERLEVPSGVESIADFAFYNRRDIKDVVMPEGFKKIGRYAFYNCTSVQNLYIPSTMKEIDDYAFTGFFVGNNISRLYFPEGFERIGEGAFMSSFNLKIVELPSTLTYIGYLAFGMSNSLEIMSFTSTTPPIVGTYENDGGDVLCEVFSIINAGKTTIYVPGGRIDGVSVLESYRTTPGFETYATYIKSKPDGDEVGHYGDGETFIDLDGCDTIIISTLRECDTDTSADGGSRYELVQIQGSYELVGAVLKITLENQEQIIAIYSDRTVHLTIDGEVKKLVEPKYYYDSYNWTNFRLYEIGDGEGLGLFDMYGSFLTPFEWRTEGEDFYIRIDGNNKLPENSDYIGVVEYAGEYDAITDSFTVSFMLNDYAQMMNFACQRTNQIYATGEVIRFFGTYKCFATANPDYAMFTLVSYGNGRVDVYIGDQPYKDCTYIVEDGVISIDFQTLTLVFTIDKDGRLDGDFLGTPCHFDYIDELMDSTKLPGRDDTEQ